MFRNYITTALRQLRKHRSYTVINVIGLSLGMTVCMLIVLYLQDERSFGEMNSVRIRIGRISGMNKITGRPPGHSKKIWWRAELESASSARRFL